MHLRSILACALLVCLAVPWAAVADEPPPEPSPAASEMLKSMREKGLLSEEEYEDLYRRQAKYESQERAANALPGFLRDWTVGGDLRLRYDYENLGSTGKTISPDDVLVVGEDNVNLVEGRANNVRNRYQLRFRIGAEKLLGEGLLMGFRIATAQGTAYGTTAAVGGTAGLFTTTVNADPRSTNVTMGNYFSGKGIYLDRAYLAWTPEFAPTFRAVAGKFANPFTDGRNYAEHITWDPDINPEGAAIEYGFEFVPDALRLDTVGAFFVLDEVGSVTVENSFGAPIVTVAPRYDERDPYMYGFQAGVTGTPHDWVTANARVSYYALRNLNTSFVAAVNGLGNTGAAVENNPLLVVLTPASPLFQNGRSNGKIDELVADAYVSFDPYGDERFRIKPFGLWTSLLSSRDQDQGWAAGFELGDIDLLRLTVMYARLQRDATVALFTDSDIFNGLTNAKGWYLAVERRLTRALRVRAAIFKSRETQEPCAIAVESPDLCENGLTVNPDLYNEFGKTARDRFRAQIDLTVDF